MCKRGGGEGGIASFPGLPRFFCSSVSVDTETEEQKKRGRPGNEAKGGRGEGGMWAGQRGCVYCCYCTSTVPLTSYWCRKGLFVKEGFLVRLTPFFLE